MDLEDFYIGLRFFTGSGEWLCTDIGTRTIIAIRIQDEPEKYWINGPPYDIEENVFDDFDFGGCYLQSIEK